MPSISKADLIKLIDERLPEDAQIRLFSSMMYETFDISKETIDDLFAPVTTVFDSDDMPEDIGDATYIIAGA